MVEVVERLFGLCGWPRARYPPLSARRIGAAFEIHSIPELGVNPLIGVVVDADRAAALLAQLLGDLRKSGLAAGETRAAAYVQRRREGDLDRALADMDELVRLVPRSAAVWHGRGKVHFARDDI